MMKWQSRLLSDFLIERKERIKHVHANRLGLQRIKKIDFSGNQIACGYEDANDCDALCSDPGFKAACGRLPLQGEDLSSQPTMSRFENQMSRSDLYRIARAFVDAFIASYKKPPRAIILDIDDTQDTVYGTQQLAQSSRHHNRDQDRYDSCKAWRSGHLRHQRSERRNRHLRG